MAEGVEVGTGYVSILPSTKKIYDFILKDLAKAFDKAGVAGGKELGDSLRDSLKKSSKGLGEEVSETVKKEYKRKKPKLEAPEIKPAELSVNYDEGVFDRVFADMADLRGDLLDVAKLDISDPITRLERDMGTAASSQAITKLKNELGEIAKAARIEGRLDVSGVERLGAIRKELAEIDREAKDFRVDIKGDVDIDVDSEAEEAGASAGDSFAGGFGGALTGAKGGIVTLAAGIALAAGAAMTLGLSQYLDSETANNQFQASLLLDNETAGRLGKLGGEIWAQNYGDSRANTLDVLRTSFLNDQTATNAELANLVKTSFNVETAFNVDAGEFSSFISQIDQASSLDASALQDIAVASFANADKTAIGDLMEAVREYLPFAEALGLTTEETFALFTRASRSGVFALDKSGDALKEFTIRSVDGSATSKKAFRDLGLNADDMAKKLLDPATAGGAFDQVIDKLLAVENPAKRAELAVALFGEPVNDLGVQQIPAFLAQMNDVPGSMLGVEDASKRLDEQVNSGLVPAFNAAKRAILDDFLTSVTARFGPEMDSATGFANDFLLAVGEGGLAGGFNFLKGKVEESLPGLSELSASIDENLSPIMSDFAGFLREDLTPQLERFGSWIVENVNPVIDEFAVILADDVLPAVNDAYEAFQRDLLPILKELWAWIDANVIPVIDDLASSFLADLAPGAQKTFDIFVLMVDVSWDRLITGINNVKDAINLMKDAAGVARDVLAAIGVIDGEPTPAPSGGIGGGGGSWGSVSSGGPSGGGGSFVPPLVSNDSFSVGEPIGFGGLTRDVSFTGTSGINIGQINMTDRSLSDELVELQSRYGVLV